VNHTRERKHTRGQQITLSGVEESSLVSLGSGLSSAERDTDLLMAVSPGKESLFDLFMATPCTRLFWPSISEPNRHHRRSFEMGWKKPREIRG